MTTPEQNKKTFGEALAEAISARGLSIGKIAELSGVPERFVEALRTGNYNRLPPAPYIKGYLNKISAVIGSDQEELWVLYKIDNPVRTSGRDDRLPVNRFYLKKVNKRKIALGIVTLAVLSFVVWRFDSIVGQPSIDIRNPSAATLVVNTDTIRVDGFIKSSDKLSINNEDVGVGGDGHFEKEVRLDPGMNTIDFRVKRFLGREADVIKKIIYQP